MSIKVKNYIKSYSEIGLNFKDDSDVEINSGFNTSDYVEIKIIDKNLKIYVKASDLKTAIDNAVNNNHLR